MLEHRLAKIAAGLTFLLLIIGGMVNATGSSLACPEAFVVCHKSLFPAMVGGVFYEHGHRLAAMTAGLVTCALAIVIFLQRRDLRWLGALLVGMVLVQGLFGATTVHYKLLWFVSTGHLLLGMVFFAMLVYTAVRTRPASAAELERHERRRADLGPARTWIAIASGAVFVQLLLGALVRHFGAWLACIGMPACTPTGEWWPGSALPDLHMIHRGFGVIVAIVTTIAAVVTWRRAKSWPQLRVLAIIAPVLVAGQIALGVLTVLTMRAVPIAVAHFAGGASLWGLWISAWLMTARRTAAPDVAPALATAHEVTA